MGVDHNAGVGVMGFCCCGKRRRKTTSNSELSGGSIIRGGAGFAALNSPDQDGVDQDTERTQNMSTTPASSKKKKGIVTNFLNLFRRKDKRNSGGRVSARERLAQRKSMRSKLPPVVREDDVGARSVKKSMISTQLTATIYNTADPLTNSSQRTTSTTQLDPQFLTFYPPSRDPKEQEGFAGPSPGTPCNEEYVMDHYGEAKNRPKPKTKKK